MPQKNDERNIILALQAIENDPKLSARAAAKIYSADPRKVQRRIKGMQPRRDIPANSRKLTDLEEDAIVERILDLSSKGFPPRLSVVRDMANRLLTTRGVTRVAERWPNSFVRRRPELATCFTRKYDYQRAKCEDPKLIHDWFALVRNTIAKYGIDKADIYNFDETGFMMGVISTSTVVTSSDGRQRVKMVQPGNRKWVTSIQRINSQDWTIPPFIIVAGKNHLASWYENSRFPPNWVISVSENGWTTNEKGMDWLLHFDKYTRTRTTGIYRLLVLDGHESHHSDKFEQYCKENKIITLCMPAHSSHLLQPLDVGCFGPLKTVYGKQIEDLIRAHITHITKEDFFPAFLAAFNATMTEKNILGGFRGAGLVPLDPEMVISKLDLTFNDVTPPTSRPNTSQAYIPKTPNNPIELASQSAYVARRIADHQNSSPTAIFEAARQLSKGSTKIIHQVTIIIGENESLQKMNKLISKRRRTKKSRLQLGGSLSQQDAQELLDHNGIAEQIKQEVQARGGRRPRIEIRARRCGICGKTGHNARTCEIIKVPSEDEDFN